MPTPRATFDRLADHYRQIALLTSIESMLGWDERCLLPPAGGDYRAEQMTLLAGMVHKRLTEPWIGDALGELAGTDLAADPASDTGASIRQWKRQYDRKVKLPQALVEELARIGVLGQQVWEKARRDSDFAAFAPILTKIVELKRQQADALGYPECRYDALLDDFEPGELTSNVARVLSGLRAELVPLVAEIAASGRTPDVSLVHRQFPVEKQAALGHEVAAKIGFDFARGRLDTTAHPFCSGMGPHDCRITTRYDAAYFNSAFFGILHEAGHAIYEQGLRSDWYGLPPGETVSLGIHESQSRLWENLVGRSRAFWQHFYPAVQTAFPQSLAAVPLDAFCFAINDVRPSLIRVEADEATYNLHILLRFELEQDLLNGDLTVPDLPAAWRDKYREYLGLEPSNDAEGVLQDIHWSGGAIGYFATYSLGNLYASQFFGQADRDLGGLVAQFARGEFAPLRTWLTEKIHSQGQRYTAAQLAQRVTGKPLSHAPLIAHLREKLGPLYGL